MQGDGKEPETEWWRDGIYVCWSEVPKEDNSLAESQKGTNAIDFVQH